MNAVWSSNIVISTITKPVTSLKTLLTHHFVFVCKSDSDGSDLAYGSSCSRPLNPPFLSCFVRGSTVCIEHAHLRSTAVQTHTVYLSAWCPGLVYSTSTAHSPAVLFISVWPSFHTHPSLWFFPPYEVNTYSARTHSVMEACFLWLFIA